jgi:hypothetical protein
VGGGERPDRRRTRLRGRRAHRCDRPANGRRGDRWAGHCAAHGHRADRDGAWNPLLATGTGIAEARRLCDDALLGIKLALSEAQFTDARLVHALLARELARSVHRVFSRAAGDAQTAAEPYGDVPAARKDGIAVTGTSALMSASAGGAPIGCGLPVASLTAAGPGMLSGVLRYYRRAAAARTAAASVKNAAANWNAAAAQRNAATAAATVRRRARPAS